SRLMEYQPRWLDEACAGGTWTWTCHGEGDTGPGHLAFFQRDTLAEIPSPLLRETSPVEDAEADRVYDAIRATGASFVTDLARKPELPPSHVRAALWRLVRRGIVTNDRFDVVRRGEEKSEPEPRVRGGMDRRALTRRRLVVSRPEGRWSLVPWGMSD